MRLLLLLMLCSTAAAAPVTEQPLPDGAARRLGGTRLRHAERVGAVALSADGKYVASGAGDDTFRVWDAATGAQLYAARPETLLDRVEAIAFVGDRVIFQSGSNPLGLVATKDWSEQGELTPCAKHGTRAFAPAPDGKWLAVTCENVDALRLQPLDGGAPVAIAGLKKPSRVVWSGTTIAVQVDGAIQLIDARTRKLGKRLVAQSHAFALAGNVLAYDTDDRVVLYDVAAGKQVGEHKIGVGADAIAFDGARLVIAQMAGKRTLVAIDVATGKRRELLRPTRTIKAIALAAGDRVWLAHDQGIRLYDLGSDAEVLGPAGHIGGITALAFRPDGKALASGSTDATIRLWDLASGAARVLQVLTDEYGIVLIDSDDDYKKSSLGQITGLAWSRDGARLYETDGFIGSGSLRTWDAARGDQLHAKEEQAIGIRRFALAADESTAWTLGHEAGLVSTLRWVDPKDGNKRRALEDVGDHALAVSPDGKILAVDGGGEILVLDAASGKKLRSIAELVIYAAAFSPDGKRLAIGNSSSAFVVELAGGKRVQRVDVDGGAYAVAFTADGRLVAGGYHGDVVVASAHGEPVVHHAHTGIVNAIAIAPDGKSFATGAADGQILLWPL